MVAVMLLRTPCIKHHPSPHNRTRGASYRAGLQHDIRPPHPLSFIALSDDRMTAVATSNRPIFTRTLRAGRVPEGVWGEHREGGGK